MALLLNEIEDTFADKNEDRLAEERLNKLHHTQFKDITTFFAAFDSCALTAGYLQVKREDTNHRHLTRLLETRLPVSTVQDILKRQWERRTTYLSPTFTLEYQDWKEIAIELSVVYDRINMIKDERKGSPRNEGPKPTTNPPWREKNQNRPSSFSWKNRTRAKMPQT